MRPRGCNTPPFHRRRPQHHPRHRVVKKLYAPRALHAAVPHRPRPFGSRVYDQLSLYRCCAVLARAFGCGKTVCWRRRRQPRARQNFEPTTPPPLTHTAGSTDRNERQWFSSPCSSGSRTRTINREAGSCAHLYKQKISVFITKYPPENSGSDVICARAPITLRIAFAASANPCFPAHSYVHGAQGKILFFYFFFSLSSSTYALSAS